MSLSAMCIAIRDAIQAAEQIDEDGCEVNFTGNPKGNCGETFYTVHPLAWTAPNGDWDLHEDFTIGVTVTMRMGFAPKDRWGVAVWLGDDGLDARVRRIITLLHHSQTVRIAANAATEVSFGVNTALTFTPPQLLRIELPKVQDHNWFGAPPPTSETQVAECGVSQTLVFGKMQRMQALEYME